MRRINRSIQSPNRMYSDKPASSTTLSFRDEMMTHGAEGEMKAQHRARYERKPLPTRRLEDTATEGGSDRSCDIHFHPMRADPPRELLCSPMSPAKTLSTMHVKSPISTMSDWNGGREAKSYESSDHGINSARSNLRRTHSAPQDVIPNQPARHQRPSRRFSRPMIEVLPGQSMPMIGFSETKHYFRQGNCVRVSCMQCTMSLYCAMDAAYMLCAMCESISPLRYGEHELPLLGFGVTMDQISE